MNLLPVDVFQKGVLLDLVNPVSPQPLLRIAIEQSKTKVKRLQSRKLITSNRFEGYWHGHKAWLLQELLLDFLKQFSGVRSFKWHFLGQHKPHHDSQLPPIRFKRERLSFQDFGREIAGSASGAPPPFGSELLA